MERHAADLAADPARGWRRPPARHRARHRPPFLDQVTGLAGRSIREFLAFDAADLGDFLVLHPSAEADRTTGQRLLFGADRLCHVRGGVLFRNYSRRYFQRAAQSDFSGEGPRTHQSTVDALCGSAPGRAQYDPRATDALDYHAAGYLAAVRRQSA